MNVNIERQNNQESDRENIQVSLELEEEKEEEKEEEEKNGDKDSTTADEESTDEIPAASESVIGEAEDDIWSGSSGISVDLLGGDRQMPDILQQKHTVPERHGKSQRARVGTKSRDAETFFDQKGQTVTWQYNAGRDINFTTVQNFTDLKKELRAMRNELGEAYRSQIITREVSAEIEPTLSKAIKEANNPQPRGEIIQACLNEGRQVVHREIVRLAEELAQTAAEMRTYQPAQEPSQVRRSSIQVLIQGIKSLAGLLADLSIAAGIVTVLTLAII